MAKQFRGSTAEASSVILAGPYWHPGLKLTGIYLRSFETKLNDGQVSSCHQFICMMPQTIEVPINAKGRFDAEGTPTKVDKFAVGALTGVEMALDALRVNSNGEFKGFQMRDKVTFECTGITAGMNGQSDMPEFSIAVER